ncbi:MAG: carbohydrate ABC transporter permease [Elusimicrobia bacterium]|nr:carbohydrate ABC transporter permease [Elusimicrobiota bacterium]
MRAPWPLRLLLGAAVVAIVAWSLAPFLWQIITSLKSPHEVVRVPPTYWPETASFASYVRIFTTRPFATYIVNSLIVAAGTTALCTVLGTLAAYAFARLRLPGGEWATRAILFISLFPATILVVPLYRLIQAAGLLNQPLGLILPYTALNLPLSIWVLTTFFKQVPADIEEAAQMDGFSRWGILWRIIFPLSAPAIATTAILVFIFSWNEFLLALTFMSRDAARTVPVGIALLSGVTVYEVPWDQISAAVVITTLPVVAMVLAFQRRIIEGLTAGAVKG